MYLKNQNKRFPCSGFSPAIGEVRFFGVAGFSGTATGALELFSDGDFLMADFRAEDFARQSFEGETLMLTNEPLPPPAPEPTIEIRRGEALKRIDGKCSGAIASGVAVGGKRYKLTPTAQGNLATAQAKIDGGAAKLIYAADGEEPSLHTAAQITAISDAAYKWGVVNTSYYAKLKVWIGREVDAAVLGAVEYGKKLPADLMQELAGLLGSVGIDLAEYAGAFR